ncbi:hypothetical protein M9H77_14267 [Catharanthus roseus]|uniref:Uncharacterized protein n=1 Tax=Catharanthus roseus TaxID=4058 RepID=A0ACC0BMT4_CATRO|nr:hypothetical protein M9H77_14267 [Catharanthus roseus]
MVGTIRPDSSYSTHDLRFQCDQGLGEEPDKVQSLHIEGEEDERADDGGNGDDDNDGEDARDEEQPMPLAPVGPTSGSNGRPRHRKGKGLTGSFMSVMSKISRSCNKRLDKARDVPVPTQRKRVKAWIYMYFLMFVPAQYPILGYKTEHKLLDIHLRLDMMSADEVRWTPYKLQEIRYCWVFTWHGFIAYFDCIEPYMPDRVVR